MKIKNFKSNLALVCKKDGYIHFIDGFVYVNNTYVFLKQKLSLHGFTPKEEKFMNGKSIALNVFKEIFRYDEVYVDGTGFNCSKKGVDCSISFSRSSIASKEPKVITDFSMDTPIVSLSVDPDKVAILQKSLIFVGRKQVELRLDKDLRILKATTPSIEESEQVGVLKL